MVLTASEVQFGTGAFFRERGEREDGGAK